MTFHIYVEGEAVECSLAVPRGSVSCRKALSWDLSYPFGTSELKLELRDDFLDGERFKPLGLQRIRWTADDGTGIVLFDGVIVEPESGFDGFIAGGKLLKYNITALDPTYLLTKKLVPEDTYRGYTPGSLVDQLAVLADSRITLATDNDVGMAIEDVKLARKNVKDTIEELLKGGGLFGWIDENWVFHHKNYATILNQLNNAQFNINDNLNNTIYKNLKLREDIEELCTRIYCIGSQMDAGNINPQNRKQGKEKRADKTVIKTATIENINAVRSRLGVPGLALVLNPEALTSDTHGILEKDLPCQEIYGLNTLNEVAETYIDMYSVPWVKGSVTYTKPGIVPGRSIIIDSASRQLQAVVPIIEVNIETSEAGQNNAGNREYSFNVSLNGPSKINKIRQSLRPPVEKCAKGEKLIKPMYPTAINTTSFNIDNTLVSENVTGIIRSTKNY